MVQSAMPGPLIVFSLSFVLSLSGALMPGPMLTYTVTRTLQTARAGWLTGARVVSGHAALEALVVIGLVLGVGSLLQSALAITLITAVGAALLVFMGLSLLRETMRGARKRAPDRQVEAPVSTAGRGSVAMQLSPVVAGLLVSASNPYWWVWWVTIGSAFLIRYDVTLQRWPVLLAFFVGHELGDLGWFSAVSIALSLGKSRIPPAVMTGIQAFCGIAIVGFGAWLAVSTFLLR
jgi:threonine/homoserine/homoserine lactone efflux protein